MDRSSIGPFATVGGGGGFNYGLPGISISVGIFAVVKTSDKVQLEDFGGRFINYNGSAGYYGLGGSAPYKLPGLVGPNGYNIGSIALGTPALGVQSSVSQTYLRVFR